jgi:hypothetical protein
MMFSAPIDTDETREIERTLGQSFGEVRAQRIGDFSIRVRIVDQRFRGKRYSDREAAVNPMIGRMPESLQQDIILLVLLAPEEVESSLLGMEFDWPTAPNRSAADIAPAIPPAASASLNPPTPAGTR